MFNRTAIMRTAWAEYRRDYGSEPFDRATFAAVLRQRWATVRLVGNRAAIMAAAWANYREVASRNGYARFDRRLFGRVLRMAWIAIRADLATANRERRAARPVKATPRTVELAEALETVRYLPAHMSAARAEAAIRARYAV